MYHIYTTPSVREKLSLTTFCENHLPFLPTNYAALPPSASLLRRLATRRPPAPSPRRMSAAFSPSSRRFSASALGDQEGRDLLFCKARALPAASAALDDPLLVLEHPLQTSTSGGGAQWPAPRPRAPPPDLELRRRWHGKDDQGMGKTKTCSSSSSCSSSWWADDGGPALLAPPAPPLPLLLLLPARPQRRDWRRNGVLQRNGCCFFWCRFIPRSHLLAHCTSSTTRTSSLCKFVASCISTQTFVRDMEGRDDVKSDEILLPGFRFHPTDEELVSFYLKKKIQQKPISIELIRQQDIYKFDPWDLPKLASTSSETEWYFYCPRDRKYRKSTRPNRVTATGFWKATGTDRPIYSSEGTRCVGLKKSLVFYKGRAARGIKTDWMMHEFRLPSLTDPSLPKRPIDKNIPLNDSWTICRIFKKTSSMAAQRALSHAWGATLPGAPEQQHLLSAMQPVQASHFASESSTSSLQVAAVAPSNHFISFNCGPSQQVLKGPIILPFQTQAPSGKTMRTVPPPLFFDAHFGQPEQIAGFVTGSSVDVNSSMSCRDQESSTTKRGGNFRNNEWEAPERLDFPFGLVEDSSDDWECNIPWESFLSPTVPAEIPQH
ncbi:uncharacterized protein LOC125535333 [Triticum urartu]|nr:uncharacterized protein LOC125535333 [Triticum urartu]